MRVEAQYTIARGGAQSMPSVRPMPSGLLAGVSVEASSVEIYPWNLGATPCWDDTDSGDQLATWIGKPMAVSGNVLAAVQETYQS
jgi:hypothetical protein